jgi:putative transcriptional regulator
MTQDRHKDMDKGYLSGKVLIATPAIGDPRFDHTLILMCDHSDEHAMGIILNKPVEGLRMPALFEQLGVEGNTATPDRPVMRGGPVEEDRGFVLHTKDFDVEGATLPVSGKLGLTATKDALEAIASTSPPRHSLIALGYAGWGPGQIEIELAANAWLIVDADDDLIFEGKDEDKWKSALDKIGVAPEHLSSLSGNA